MLLDSTANWSLRVQIYTAFVDAWGLSIKVKPGYRVYKDLLRIELWVQMIELIFYVWMVRNMRKVPNITLYRYLDWVFTTPLMLITLIVYLDHDPSIASLKDYLQRNKKLIKKVLALNWAMLGAGFLGEAGVINRQAGATVGTFPFLAYFKAIWDELIRGKALSREKLQVFWWFFTVWSGYGIAALAPYEIKNAGYNVLDLFAKNFFGVFLVWVIWKNRA